MIVITGPGRSGTSFLADLYRHLGFDPGGGWKDDVRAGLEEHETVEINSELARRLSVPFGNPRPPFGSERWDLVGELAEEFGPRVRTLAEKWEVLKDPRFCWTLRVWLEAGAKIDHVTCTLRRVNDIVASSQHADMAKPEDEQGVNKMRSTSMFRIGSLLTAIGEYDVPHTVLWFPDYLSDPDGLYHRLVFPRPVKEWRFKRALKKTLKPELITFGKVGGNVGEKTS